MTRTRDLMAATAIALIGTWPLTALAQAAEDPHHPAAAAAQTTPQPPTAPGSGGQPGMQGMMGGMSMMNMMGMMQMMGSDGPGMGMIDRVEGRIAFLRTELKITDAQAGAWNAFAVAFRTNAQSLGTARGAMMGQMGAGQPQAQTLTQRLDAQERWLTARLEGTRAIKTAFTTFYSALSEDQKKTADELLAPHMGMGMGSMMSMMRGAQ